MNFNEITEVLNCMRQVDQYLRLHSLGTNEIWKRLDDNISMLEMVQEDYQKARENAEEMAEIAAMVA